MAGAKQDGIAERFGEYWAPMSGRGTTRARPVLLVGGDDITARVCARVAAPLAIVRAKHLATAAERFRAMRPVAVVVAHDVPVSETTELRRIAAARAAPIVLLTAHGSDPEEQLRVALRR